MNILEQQPSDEESMVNYGLENRVALITGANNPQGIGAATALAFAREGAQVALVYKRIDRPFDPTRTDRNGADRYFAANAGKASGRGIHIIYYIVVRENAGKSIAQKSLSRNL